MTNKALILIDYINDIVHPQGKMASCADMMAKQCIMEKCNATLAYSRQQKWLIIWIKVAFSNGYPEISNNSPIFSQAQKLGALIKNSWGTELLHGLNYQSNELIIYKNRINPFHATNLELILNTNRIQELYLAGVATEWAVEAMARDAHDKNFLVNIISDLCASSTEENKLASLKVMARIATIINSQELAKV